MAELMLSTPLFPGESGIDQLVEIIKVLGTPTREQIKTMNPNVSGPIAFPPAIVVEMEWISCGGAFELTRPSTWSTSSLKSNPTHSPKSSGLVHRPTPSA